MSVSAEPPQETIGDRALRLRKKPTLTNHEHQERLRELGEARREFQRITEGAADAIARAFHDAKQRKRRGDARTLQAITQERVNRMPGGEALTVVEGGIAGGVKVADRSTGAFFKIAEDTVDIYQGSSVMADKAAKHELAMLTHLHDADETRLLTVPLASCVDVTVRDAEGRVEGVYRVQGFSRHAVSGRTLRVGSDDGRVTLHVCAALDSVAEELAAGLHLAPSRMAPTSGWFMRHEYRRVRGARDAARFPHAGPATDALLESAGAGRHAAESSGVCAQVEAEHGVVLDPLRPVHADHSATEASDAGGVTRRLPFDVELHALPWGEVVLLDTHRLCIPDVVGDAEAAGGGGGGQVAIVAADAVEEQLVECWRSGRGDDVASVRGAVKAGLHSRGLGLRHAWTVLAVLLDRAAECEAGGALDPACMVQVDRLDTALTMLESCRRVFAASPGEDHPTFAKTLFTMAQCRMNKGEFDEAFGLAERAERIFATKGFETPLF
ncbi:hypothetical protein FNF28_01834 [Cafeteria roenbergensis]|uniref:Uncharacterized protein n=1 Tax=Cafeteria roenbergensis TaxID=33653 RepID=A0A5A8DZ70_CAFRO|nr:hypothetical protein FNF28_01834 [Cafeteria roenbergensis]